ncbi:SRPBCC family protein [Portibacter lacus]|uniref:Transcriptional regulator n=1 Tax=Portibacter lacus TaxID=1099794 RepID=A0AA37SPF5_9BACT|nr:SRPBCC family protein [Portibacter lacus]GLR16416.1 transcriptional regulator [Portibacter lacus]
MPKFTVSRSILINAPVEKVFNTINDLNTWVVWSPWLIMDRATVVNVSGDAKSYDWNGKRTGSGDMRIINEVEYETIDLDLNFIKPFKSHAKVNFTLNSEGNNTNVTWNMDSSLPFFMFWMKKMMMAFIGNDYERGLNLLKDYVEDGEIHSELNFIGEHQFSGSKYIGVERETNLDTAASKMGEDIQKLHGFGDMSNVFMMYKKWDMVKNQAHYLAGMFVDEIPSNLPAEFIQGQIPSTKIYTLEHVGPYRHLGNAWSTMSNMQRSKEFKVRKDIFPFETYKNDPGSTAENELLTHINFAVK